MIVTMAALFVALVLLQDPGEEIRELLRRLESSTATPAESAELVLRLGLAVEQIAPGQARLLLGDALRTDRLPPARRLDLAETLLGLEDRLSWSEEAGRIALDATESAETRMRAALLLARAGSSRATEVGRALDERLFSEGTDEAARALGTHLREGASLDLQRLEIDFLFRIPVPGARAALWEALADDGLDPLLRLEIAERLHEGRALDRARDARAALDRIRALRPALADRANRLLSALRGIREEPASVVASEPEAPAPAKKHPKEKKKRSAGRVNFIIGGATLAIVAALLATKRRS